MTVLFVYPLVCFVCGHSYSKHIHTKKNLFVHLLPVKHVCVVSNKSAGQVKLSGGRSSGRLLCDSSSPYQDHSRCPLQQAWTSSHTGVLCDDTTATCRCPVKHTHTQTQTHTHLQHRNEQYNVHCRCRPIARQIYHSILGLLNVFLVLDGYWSHSFELLSPLHRVSLDPKAQRLVGVLRFYLSQFSPKYRRGSVMEENPPEALQKPLAQWVHTWTHHCCPSESWPFLTVLHWLDGKGWNHLWLSFSCRTDFGVL